MQYCDSSKGPVGIAILERIPAIGFLKKMDKILSEEW